MSNPDHLAAATELLRRDFALDTGAQPLPEEDLLDLLADHLAWLIEHRMEWLLSLLYRMDIDEAQVGAALHPLAPEPANVGLARLVLARQKERARTKQAYRPPDLGKDEQDDWSW